MQAMLASQVYGFLHLKLRLAAQVITASSDGTVRVWDSKTADCVTAFRPPQATPSGEVGVLAVAPHPGNVDHVVVCTRSPTVYLMTLQGQARLVFPLGFMLRVSEPNPQT